MCGIIFSVSSLCGSKLSILGGRVGEGFGETTLGAMGGLGFVVGILESFSGLGDRCPGLGDGLGESLGPTGMVGLCKSIPPLTVGNSGNSETLSLIGFLATGGGASLCESNRFLTHAGASSENEPLFERTHGARFSSSLSSTLVLLTLSTGLRLFS